MKKIAGYKSIEMNDAGSKFETQVNFFKNGEKFIWQQIEFDGTKDKEEVTKKDVIKTMKDVTSLSEKQGAATQYVITMPLDMGLLEEKEEKNTGEKTEWVTVELSRKQVLYEQGVYHNDKTDKDYVRCIIPDGGTFYYPTTSLKVKDSDPNIVTFSRPKGTEIQLRYSKLKDGVDMSFPNEEKYENTFEMITVEALAERLSKKYSNNKTFVGIDISEKLVTNFESHDGRKFASASVPVYEQDEQATWYEIVVPRNFILDSKQNGKVYLSMFKNGIDGNPYTYEASRSVFDTTINDYVEVKKTMTSEEVVAAYKESARRYATEQASSETIDDVIRQGR